MSSFSTQLETVRKLDTLLSYVKTGYIYHDKVKSVQSTLSSIGLEADINLNMFTTIPSYIGKETLVNKITSLRNMEMDRILELVNANRSIREDIVLAISEAYNKLEGHVDRFGISIKDYNSLLSAIVDTGVLTYVDDNGLQQKPIKDMSLYTLNDTLTSMEHCYIAFEYDGSIYNPDTDISYVISDIHKDFIKLVNALVTSDANRILLNIFLADDDRKDLYLAVQTDDIQILVHDFFLLFIDIAIEGTIVRYGRSGMCGSYLVENQLRLLDKCIKEKDIHKACLYLDKLRKYLIYIETTGNLLASL